MQSRAVEREIVRYERAQERARIRAEREDERRRIAEARERAQQKKQEAKEAQVLAWKLEYEEHQEREQEIDRVANDAPEVEDRDRLFAELAVPRVFEPPPFVPPKPPNSAAKAQKLRRRAEEEIESALSAFRPDVRHTRWVQAVAAVIGIGGGVLCLAYDVVATGAGVVVTIGGVGSVVAAQLVADRQGQKQREAVRAEAERGANERLQQALEALAREDEERARAHLHNAKTVYETEITAARQAFDLEEQARLDAVGDVVKGDLDRMREALDAVFPVELPVPHNVTFDVRSASVVGLAIDVPEPSVLPNTEAKLLASGKVTYKEKNEKRLREQYLRLVTGLALRYASETMLYLPTCQRVDVRAFRTMLDPSVGKPARRCVLEVQFDYPTLAPMTMEGIDPVSALKHFQHRVAVDRNRELQAIDEP